MGTSAPTPRSHSPRSDVGVPKVAQVPPPSVDSQAHPCGEASGEVGGIAPVSRGSASQGLVFPETPKSLSDLSRDAEAILKDARAYSQAGLRDAAVQFAAHLSNLNPSKENYSARLADALCVCLTEGRFTSAERKDVYWHAGPAAACTRLWSSSAVISSPALEGMALKTLQYPPTAEPGEDPKPFSDRLEIIQKSVDRLAYFVGREKTPAKGREAAWDALQVVQADIGEVPALAEVVRLPDAALRPLEVARRAEPREGIFAECNRDEVNKVALGKLTDLLVSGDTAQIRAAWEHTARFHKYSLTNRILIMVQDPDATVVASANRWKDHGFDLKDGQKPKSIDIWVPIFGLSKEKEEQGRDGERDDSAKQGGDAKDGGRDEARKQLKGFVLGRVYDVRQVEPIPGVEQKDIYGLQSPALLKQGGDQEALDVMIAALQAEGIRVAFRDNLGTLEPLHHGTSRGGLVEVLDMLPLSEKLRVLAHEWAHEILHQREVEIPDSSDPEKKIKVRRGLSMTRDEKEMEADSTACVVLSYLGADASEATWAYLKGYGIDKARLEAGIPLVLRAADEMRSKLVKAEQTREQAESQEALETAAEVESMAESVSDVKASVRARMERDSERFAAQAARFQATLERFKVGGAKSNLANVNIVTVAMLDAVFEPNDLEDHALDASLASGVYMGVLSSRIMEFGRPIDPKEKLAMLAEVMAEHLESETAKLKAESFSDQQAILDIVGDCRAVRDPWAANRLVAELSSAVANYSRECSGMISAVEKQAIWLAALDPGCPEIGVAQGVIREARERDSAMFGRLLQIQNDAIETMRENLAQNMAAALKPTDSLGRWRTRDWDGNHAVGERFVSNGVYLLLREGLEEGAVAAIAERAGKTPRSIRPEALERVWGERNDYLEAGQEARVLGVLENPSGVSQVVLGAQEPGGFLEIGLPAAHFRTIRHATRFEGVRVNAQRNTVGFLKNGRVVAVAASTPLLETELFQATRSITQVLAQAE